MLNFTKPSRLLLYLFVVILITIILLFTGAEGEVGTYGVSKTIGWAFAFCDFVDFFVGIALLLYLTVYGILSIFKANVNRVISVTHFITMLVSLVFLIFSQYEMFCIAGLLFPVCSVMLLLANIIYVLAKIAKRKSS